MHNDGHPFHPDETHRFIIISKPNSIMSITNPGD